MWFSRRTPKLPHRSRRSSLLVEQLESRELLNGSPLPAPPWHSQPPAVSLAALQADGLLPGYALPSGVSRQAVSNLPSQGWQGAPQLPAILGPLQHASVPGKGPFVQIPLVLGWNQSSSPNGEGYTPAQLQQAYGFNQIKLPAGETFNDAGSGQTIAIIDALDDPYIRPDLQTFDQTFNIGGAAHDPTSTSFFKVVNENGGSTLPPTDNGQVDFGLETSLDVEWAHAMAPGANILLVEASTPFSINDLGTAIETAARQPGVSVISMSFGFGDGGPEWFLDNMFTTPAGHQGVSFVASAGDNGGFSAEYPAMSPNVLGVGGTTLPADASGNPNREQESAWSLGGGGISNAEAEPAYQLGVQSTGSRTGPDLAYDADLNTGVAIYDTLFANALSPGKPWIEIGGTSAGAPQISSLVAITNQLRVAAGEATLDGANQLLPAIYQIAATDPKAFHDITTGNNGYPAGPGYDFATGFGTPNAQYLVPDLVAAYKTPPAPRTLYWTGDVSTNWDTPGNWSTVDPAVKNVQQSVLPTMADHVVVDLTGATILHDTANYDTISSFTVTAPKVTLDLGAGTIDLSGSGGRGTFPVDQNGDTVTMEAGILANADVTSGTTLFATSDPNGNYPELDNVQLDGTVNANQSGANNGLDFQNGLILNGTINLGGNKDQSSVLLAGEFEPNLGNQDNNPETISGSGTIQLGQSQNGDALFNWGTLGTFTIGPNITVLGGGSGSVALLEQTTDTGTLDNQGTFKQNGGTLVIQSFGPSLFGWEPSGTTGWTNEGSIIATGGATVGLLGGWTNSGKIGVDSHSTVLLGNPTAGQLASDPLAGYNAWSSSGSVTIADGATVYVGGFLTADQYLGLAAIPGVTAKPAADALFLDGTLDNNPADNSVSHGILNAASTPLTMAGGTIIGGTVGAGSKIQVAAATPINTNIGPLNFPPSFTAAGGSLDNVTNGGTLTATGSGVTLTLSNVTNSGTISGNTGAVIEFLNTWANTGTIKVDGTSSLFLGPPATTDPNFPPTLADGSPFAWNPNAVGSIQVADGATVGFGGLLTTDLFTAFPNLPGVSIHLAHDTVLLDGWLDNKPADNPVTGGVLALSSATGTVNFTGGLISHGTITSSGTGALNVSFSGPLFLGFDFLDSVTINAPIAVSGTPLFLEGTTVNNANMTASSFGAIVALPGGTFTNNGSMVLSNSFAGLGSSLTNTGSISVSGSQLSAGTITNSGTVSITSHGGAGFHGNYDNSHGTISVDSTSALWLGRGTLDQQNFPTIADGSPYAFDPSKVGTLQIADGATFTLGGRLTTDQFYAFPSLPGVSVHFAKDQFQLGGWLDNSPADNPRSGGVLAITPATGPLFLLGGYIYQGKITTSGPDDLEANYIGVLDNVELDGNLNVTGPFGFFGKIYIEDNMKLNGTIEMPGNFGFLSVGFFDSPAETISGTGSISMGTASSFESVVDNLSTSSLTIGPGITINAAAQLSYLVAERSQTNVLGTVEDNTASSTLYTYGFNFNTGTAFQSLANLNGGTLTGGTWEFGNGATWRTDGADITTNAANLSISGAGTQVLDSVFGQGNNALAGLTTNTATGHLTVGAGYNLTAHGTFQNAGIVEIGGTISVQGNYTQTAGAALDIDIAGPATYGTLAVSGTATLTGALNVALVNGFTPAPGASFTILSFGARSGDFSAENGLMFSQSSFFVANYLGNTLTLVVGPCVAVVAGTDLFIIGGLTSNDQVQISPVGSSNTGSTGVQVTATLNGVSTTTAFSQAFSTIYVFGFAGNDTITVATPLTINTNVRLGNGNNTITLGNGNDNTQLGDGNNVVVEGNGNDTIFAGNGNNLIVAGLGPHTVRVGNGSNILIDGSVQLTQSGDSLRQVLNDWAQYGAQPANVASIRSRLAVTYNTSYANTLTAGSGLDWFWVTYPKDSTNRKPTDLLN
jgi:hypothetical protein